MGADYRKTEKGQITCQTTPAGVAANTTHFQAINAGGGNQLLVEFPVSFDGVIEAQFAHSSAPPGVGETFTYTLMLNGIAQAQTCQIAGAVAQDANDEANPIIVVEGDLISVRIVTSLNAAVAVHSVGLRQHGY